MEKGLWQRSLPIQASSIGPKRQQMLGLLRLLQGRGLLLLLLLRLLQGRGLLLLLNLLQGRGLLLLLLLRLLKEEGPARLASRVEAQSANCRSSVRMREVREAHIYLQCAKRIYVYTAAAQTAEHV